MNKHEIRIKTGGIHAEVTINGKTIEGVREYTFTHEAGKLPQLQLSMVATDITVETKQIPALPAPYNEFYVSRQKLVEAGFVTEEQLNVL